MEREYRRVAKIRANQLLTIELVLEDVHPSHMGALPPCPRLLLAMAVRKGFVKYGEVHA